MPIDLRLDQNQIYEQHHEVMLHILVTEAPAVLAYRESHAMAGRAVVSAGVLGVEGLDGITTFNADWHRTGD